MLRILTAGESHGPACVTIIEGMPAGVQVRVEDIDRDLKRRHSDSGRGGRGLIEEDRVGILSGIRYGKTLGSPITLIVRNLDFANWQDEMSIEETEKPADKVTRPRPGHADLAGVLKYGQDDIRNISDRASARETVGRVMAGAVIRQLLLEFGIRITSHTVQIGPVRLTRHPSNFEEVASVFETDPDIRCIDSETSEKMKQLILEAGNKKDTLGGVVEVIATGAPVGLGSVMHYDRRLDGIIAQALMSIPSVKAVEIGNAIAGAATSGSEFQDRIAYNDGRFSRQSNNMGGIEGGMSNGENIVCRVYHKPISTLGKPKETVDIATHRPAPATVERSDICAVPRAGVISEAMLALALGQAMTEKFGGDHIDEMKRNFQAYIKSQEKSP
ncbi:MAG: chorismate synthase [Deltaproteobacteria bacterium]|nr:chorismate synthase [Deltaproteobacteria bacterium]